MENKVYDLIARIEDGLGRFSKGQKLIANYIIEHYDKAAFMTAAKLGEVVGVSESTVVRFANEVGFDGYPKLQKMLQELIKSKLTPVQRLEVSSNRIGEENILKSVLQSDMEKIKVTLEEIDQEAFNKVVESLINARKIYILGVRSSATLASFLGFYFNIIFDNIRLVHTTSVSEMFEQIMKASEGDVVIGISFPRYSKRTIKAMQYVKSQGATVIAITDSKESPLAAHADLLLTARSDMASFADSLVAPLSVINALIVAIGMRKKQEVYDNFEKLEKIWDEYEVYEKYDNVGSRKNKDY
ncbi:N-acetylmannosamine kinase [Clostridium thermosuccinogenes]|jgi:DNA-binding MurR/RpiR family transcriptional regulator|uniref:N-acetylmannosamine kinase n=1 Tax=Clostridium thermosuccinogenes TaxID=84032 RepID=A0A2K2FGZ2_9CLOT|nr:MurR/RpiR family transcriptional regulator [Pseudoclostridium thermosuccinogenes]AUS96244.1 N-acetylmannosamine kinase [Pseudoclostridium thermosuccinogenes]PNT93076.1 N-acetylmannosamine kinase [Pseudoclostridium thermosuccinogenes]PNT96381.1 N-acetylmannosamine kinase [Pseudoclostridium thermosuccinogenes]PNT98034.1 N-acetylmannosamine kinase [Pseudoclostridium thermosuccinogenes]